MLGFGFQLFSRAVQNRLGPAADLVNFLVNPTFATDTIWSKGTGWSIAAGVASKTAGTAAGLQQTVTYVVGASYEVIFTVTAFTAGGVTPQFTGGSTVNGTTRSALGTFTETMVAVSGNVNFRLQGNATFAGSVDNVSLRRLP